MNDFAAYLVELFQGFGPTQAKRMFGGYGIYHDGLMFGLVSDDTLYLKVDDQNRQAFEDADMTPFEYVKNGKTMHLSYYLAPAEAMDNADEAARWAVLAYDAALRAQAAKKSRKPRAAKKAGAKKASAKKKPARKTPPEKSSPE